MFGKRKAPLTVYVIPKNKDFHNLLDSMGATVALTVKGRSRPMAHYQVTAMSHHDCNYITQRLMVELTMMGVYTAVDNLSTRLGGPTTITLVTQ